MRSLGIPLTRCGHCGAGTAGGEQEAAATRGKNASARDGWDGDDTSEGQNERVGCGVMKKMGRGSDDILPAPADWAPACRAGVACHMCKCGKLETQTSLIWQNCKCHSKSDNRMSANLNNGKNVKAPIYGRSV